MPKHKVIFDTDVTVNALRQLDKHELLKVVIDFLDEYWSLGDTARREHHVGSIGVYLDEEDALVMKFKTRFGFKPESITVLIQECRLVSGEDSLKKEEG